MRHCGWRCRRCGGAEGVGAGELDVCDEDDDAKGGHEDGG